jgi:hypothetical protein
MTVIRAVFGELAGEKKTQASFVRDPDYDGEVNNVAMDPAKLTEPANYHVMVSNGDDDDHVAAMMDQRSLATKVISAAATVTHGESKVCALHL